MADTQKPPKLPRQSSYGFDAGKKKTSALPSDTSEASPQKEIPGKAAAEDAQSHLDGSDLEEDVKGKGSELSDKATPATENLDDLKDTEKPEIEKPDVEKPETEKPEVEKPDVEAPDVEAPDVGAPDVEKPDVEKPDIEKPDVEAPEIEKPELKGPFDIKENGEVHNAAGIPVAHLTNGDAEHLGGTSVKDVDEQGQLLSEGGDVVGKADLVSQAGELEAPNDAESDLKENVDEAQEGVDGAKKDVDEATPENVDEAQEGVEGEVPEGVDEAKKDVEGEAPEGVEGEVPENVDEAKEGVEGEVPEGVEGEVPENVDEAKDSVEGELPENVDEAKEGAEGEVPEDGVDAPEIPDLSILKDKKVNKLGKIVDEEGTPFGQLIEGDPKKLAGKKVDAEGQIWDDSGKVIGRAELLPEAERQLEPSSPFEDFPDAVVDKSGNVIFEGQIVGKIVEGDAKKLEGKKVDADGDILDKNGNVLGKAERSEDEEPVPEEEPEAVDLSILEGKKINKAGNVVDDNGKLFGRVVEGEVSKLVGKKVGAEGKIYSESGKVIGTAELIPVDDREQSSGAPFEDFPDAIVEKNGTITFEGQIVGRLIEGDGKKLAGKKVDQDGEVVDKVGNVLGKAERWEEEEAPAPEKADLSALAGKRVNKLGNVVDSNGDIYGRLVEGDPKKLAGKLCDKNGDIWNDGGQIVGKAELVPDSERSGQKEGPFAGFDSPTITKDGKVADSKGVIIGRLTDGDPKKLYGKSVDPDGDVLDSNGNTLGKAERWEEEEKEVKKHPAAGRKVNREGNVIDENGDLIAKLTEGEVTKCAGNEIDNDGDVVDGKGTSIGHVTLLEYIPAPEEEPEEPQETEEEIAEKKQLAEDKKLAKQMTGCVQQSIDKIQPILKMITEAIDAAERQPKEELDEQKLVDTVKPLLEQGGGILQEANGVIRGLDPDGRIQANAKGKSASREATPEEYQLAEVLKELTGSVTQTIDQAKKKIAGMPHAKKELNPLWGLLAEPLGQILAAVGLLLSGVLGLVGKLLSGLGLGGLLDGLLGGLGIKGILSGLGLGSLTKSLTGKK